MTTVPGMPIPLVLLPGLRDDAGPFRDRVADLSDIAARRVADLTRGAPRSA